MNSDTRPSFAYRFFLALVKSIITLFFLGVLIWGGYWAVRELLRSFDSVTTRVEINRRDLEELRRELDELAAEAPDQQRDMASLQEITGAIDGRLDGLQDGFSSDLERQQELLAALQERLDVAAADGQTAVDDTAALGAALVALQGDFNETNSRVDALGGEIDAFRADNETLNNSVELFSQSAISATEKASQVDDMQKTLALFHVWELVARARLRLVDDNVGLATRDLERALRAVDILVADTEGDEQEALKVLQTRLALARASLPGNLLLAASDLESVWDQLDQIVSGRVMPELLLVIEAEAAVATAEVVAPEAVETPAPETEPEATPEVTPAATPEATPTSAP